MAQTRQAAGSSGDEHTQEFDAVVAGAGFSGLGMLHALRGLGLRTRVYDRGESIGGTWYWNCYPGARTDSEYYYYCFTFSDDLLQDWEWSERYPGQPEVERYLNHVADRFDLRRDIQFDTHITSAEYDEAANRWQLRTGRGETIRCQYFISAMGLISEPYTPEIPGIGTFDGPCHHTARWPRAGLDVTGKRVGIIGAGASAIQLLPEVAETAAQVTLFQRTPNYVIPAGNHPLTAAERDRVKDNYPEILRACREHIFAMPFGEPTKSEAMAATPEERQAVYERLWQAGGFRYFFETYGDLITNEEANETAAQFLRDKIREIVDDPETAQALVPTTYPLFAKRPPNDHRYYQTFNRDNVKLVDIANKETLEAVTPTGVRTSAGDYEFDVLILATGFDAMTGALTKVDIRGRGGVSLQQKWQERLRTYFGISCHDFPNLFMITGPQAPFANIPTLIEDNIDWIRDCIAYMRDHGHTQAEASAEAEDAWAAQTNEVIEYGVARHGAKGNAWYMGANVNGKRREPLVYFGGANAYIQQCDQSKQEGFAGMVFDGPKASKPASRASQRA